MRTNADTSSATTVLFVDLLGRISIQLREAATTIKEIEDSICDLVVDHEIGVEHKIVDLQKVDLVRQQIDNLADFLHLLAIDSGDEKSIDIGRACSALKLSALVDRLLASERIQPNAHVDDNDFELFHFQAKIPAAI